MNRLPFQSMADTYVHNHNDFTFESGREIGKLSKKINLLRGYLKLANNIPHNLLFLIIDYGNEKG